MKRPARHALTIALVATALCADRAIAAAPALRPQVAQVAGKLVTRLSVSFRRVLPSIRVLSVRRDEQAPPQRLIATDTHTTAGFRTPLLPQLLRLPPPLN